MNDAATVISKVTGCTLAKAQEAVSELIARGWTPPDTERSRVDRGEVSGSTALPPGLSSVNTDKVLVAHTDGACKGNPGPGGWAVVFSQGNKAIAEFSGSDPNTTNNRMELTAVREAIRQAPANVKLEIVTDSELVIGWLSRGFKCKEPAIAALCAEIDTLRAGRGLALAADDPASGVSFTYVRGHQGDKFNERADKLANEAIAALRARGRLDRVCSNGL
jgi:ribonuclease HI